jgi:hypothetical protein
MNARGKLHATQGFVQQQPNNWFSSTSDKTKQKYPPGKKSPRHVWQTCLCATFEPGVEGLVCTVHIAGAEANTRAVLWHSKHSCV